MRSLVTTALFFCFCASALAQTIDAKAKTEAHGFLKRMAAIEAKAKPIEPMFIPLKGRTPAQDKEMLKRIDFLDALYNKEVLPLTNEVNRSQLPGQLSPVREASEALDDWVKTKLTLQNAGVNNPSLEALKKKVQVDYKTYQDAYARATTAAK